MELLFHVRTLKVQTSDNEDISAVWIHIEHPWTDGSWGQRVGQTSVGAEVIVRGCKSEHGASNVSVLWNSHGVVLEVLAVMWRTSTWLVELNFTMVTV